MTDKLKKTLTEYKKKVDFAMKEYFENLSWAKNDPIIKDYYHDLTKFMLTGGKRLRPVAMMIAYSGLDGKRDIINAALSIELLHNASLIEDDIIDGDETRRGKPTLQRIFKDKFLESNNEIKYDEKIFNSESSRISVSNAILMVNILFASGAKLLSEFDPEKAAKCLDIYNEAFIGMSEGQLLDVEYEKWDDVLEEEYLDMSEKKTAHLISAALEISAILADANKTQIQALKKYATNISLAFQIQDDLIDIDEKAKKGRPIGSDIISGKQTLLIIKALAFSSRWNQRKITKVLGNSSASKKELEIAIQTIKKSGSVEYCQQLAENKIADAKKGLLKANLNEQSQEFFLDLADYCLERIN